ncbi:hypothetical protein NJ7G_0585 [Natrinema sp. J7-2]|nr:hypothetical protein NJ7G_0585 [Natrinema sp. J7-2]
MPTPPTDPCPWPDASSVVGRSMRLARSRNSGFRLPAVITPYPSVDPRPSRVTARVADRRSRFDRFHRVFDRSIPAQRT